MAHIMSPNFLKNYNKKQRDKKNPVTDRKTNNRISRVFK